MAHVTTTVPPLQADDWGECCEKLLLPATDSNAEIIEITGYKLVYVNGACLRIYRVYKTEFNDRFGFSKQFCYEAIASVLRNYIFLGYDNFEKRPNPSYLTFAS
ncbi:hypothetical protein I8751_03575 [Nostocaceae cyanobacterium CENA357]|uniref:Uncharacterized protein n=1 Tax=Atlanticothrix silvestris CENA357 TaxID=1725252 RepID=A0A8J7H7T0_9CYAN|nr:hypothetical protein [Atlanticothrix silvestris]MBH8551474.1 hypothetical protein [Atlanticothrix silvestris CENA357]